MHISQLRAEDGYDSEGERIGYESLYVQVLARSSHPVSHGILCHTVERASPKHSSDGAVARSFRDADVGPVPVQMSASPGADVMCDVSVQLLEVIASLVQSKRMRKHFKQNLAELINGLLVCVESPSHCDHTAPPPAAALERNCRQG